MEGAGLRTGDLLTQGQDLEEQITIYSLGYG